MVALSGLQLEMDGIILELMKQLQEHLLQFAHPIAINFMLIYVEMEAH